MRRYGKKWLDLVQLGLKHWATVASEVWALEKTASRLPAADPLLRGPCAVVRARGAGRSIVRAQRRRSVGAPARCACNIGQQE